MLSPRLNAKQNDYLVLEPAFQIFILRRQHFADRIACMGC